MIGRWVNSFVNGSPAKWDEGETPVQGKLVATLDGEELSVVFLGIDGSRQEERYRLVRV